MAGGFDNAARAHPLRRRLRRLLAVERRDEAEAFLEAFHRENGTSPTEHRSRCREVRRELNRHGYYQHTPEELTFGAQLAWRNSARCIGRLVWRSLEVFDCRHLESTDDVANQAVSHLRFADNGGKIRPAISIFAPVRGDRLPCWFESRQLVQYAGYVDEPGGVLGDPLTVEATRHAQSLGWQPPSERTRFDVLPLLLRDQDDRRIAYPLPSDVVRRIRIEHPHHGGIADLGLEWYPVPYVSSMILTIGGLDYPSAPFNGYYMATEIASRNLADERRYDLLPNVGEALGLALDSPMWRDHALTALNEAVLHSFRRDGTTIVEHHTASEQFLQFRQAEASAGRPVSADWAWIVPPQAGASCSVFHVPMEDRHAVPNYYHSRATDGAGLRPRLDDQPISLWRSRLRRLRRRIRDWRRRRWS